MRKLIAFAVLIPLVFSCKKENTEIDPPNEETYMPLEVGNYWVYKHFEIDESGNETEKDIVDSVFITEDSIINGYFYYVFEGISDLGHCEMDGKILRDSSGYLVDTSGTILFAESNFTDILESHIGIINEDTIYYANYKMERLNNPITVHAGTFDVLNYKGTVTIPEEIPGVVYPRYINNYFAKKVGKVLSSYFFIHNPKVYERRLIRYHINE